VTTQINRCCVIRQRGGVDWETKKKIAIYVSSLRLLCRERRINGQYASCVRVRGWISLCSYRRNDNFKKKSVVLSAYNSIHSMKKTLHWRVG
jgi:hypothetical protein